MQWQDGPKEKFETFLHAKKFTRFLKESENGKCPRLFLEDGDNLTSLKIDDVLTALSFLRSETSLPEARHEGKKKPIRQLFVHMYARFMQRHVLG